jgi:hypothetical protein
MKHLRLILPLFLLLAFAACKSNKAGQDGKPPKGERELPADIAAAYKADAALLAVRELMTSNSTGENEANIPPARIEYFYNLLSKIYWLCADIDSIPNLSSIHTLPNPSLRRVQVILQPDASMLENWSQGISTTSDLYLNQLLSRYGCRVKDYRAGSSGPSCIIEANRDIHTPALAAALAQNNGIKLAEAEGMAGDGNNIEFGGEGKNQMALRYSIGHGDCPSGCIQRKFWIFYVSQEGVVTFMGTRGNIPAEVEPKN